ncbi:MAG: type II secretion system F family protein, partial [Planctomycetales bacterium]
MPDFLYTARDGTGTKVSGTLNAASKNEALAQLSNKALFPLQVESAPVKRSLFGRRVGANLLATTYSQMADLLRSGVPMLRALQVLERQTTHRRLKEVLVLVRGHVEDGETLSAAMARYPDVFNELAASIIRAGGEGGFLEESLDQVASFTEKQEDLKGRTLGAMAYPVLLSVFGVVVVIGLMLFVVPQFEGIFDALRERGELPLLTKALLALSKFMQAWGWIAAILLGILAFFLRTQLATERGRRVADRLKIKLPIVGNIFLNLAVSRFCRVLGTLLRNGVPILKSLQTSSDST